MIAAPASVTTQLPVITGDVAEQVEETGRVEAAELDAGAPRGRAPAGVRGARLPSQSHRSRTVTPAARPGRQRLGETAARLVVAKDVVLEVDPALGAA